MFEIELSIKERFYNIMNLYLTTKCIVVLVLSKCRVEHSLPENGHTCKNWNAQYNFYPIELSTEQLLLLLLLQN